MGISICAICVDCQNTYCDVCCHAHTKYTDHSVCQIQHVAKSHREIVCDRCLTKKAEQLCKKCWKPKCESCAKIHNHGRIDEMQMMIIYQGPPGIKRQRSEQNINHLYNISIEKKKTDDPVRICGMSYVEDGRIVLVDSNNRQIIVFKLKKEQIKLKLVEEPRGMTAMTGNLFAITFGYQMVIQIYEIFEDNIIVKENINLPKLGLRNVKPFSIAFDKDVFAVEIGEGDDGKIIILKNEKIHESISNKNNFAFFTGNTIRLALNVNNQNPLEGHVFVSAMSKKMVSCVDFKGNRLWSVPVPSPRGIIVVPEDFYPGRNLVLCSRRCSVIYGLSKDDGSDEVLLAKGKIKSPRFVSYNSNDRLLCIQVEKKGFDEDELQVFEIRLPSSAEGNSSDQLLGT